MLKNTKNLFKRLLRWKYFFYWILSPLPEKQKQKEANKDAEGGKRVGM